jgi:type IV secretory pathway VirB10-like protein
MSDPDNINRDRIERTRFDRETVVERSSGSMGIIVGGLVVAVILIIWLFTSGSNWRNATTPTTTNDPNITIEQNAPAAQPAAPADTTVPNTATPDTATPDTTAPADAAPANPDATTPPAGAAQPTPAP